MAIRPVKSDFPASNVRRHLEPGPIVLVSSAHDGRANIMTMGWHSVMEFTPGIGNTTGGEIDKFKHFGLTPETAEKVEAPRIAECHANFERRLYDEALVAKYNFFIFEIVKAHVAASPKHPKTIHYTGDGVFVVSGAIISRRAMFKPGTL